MSAFTIIVICLSAILVILLLILAIILLRNHLVKLKNYIIRKFSRPSRNEIDEQPLPLKSPEFKQVQFYLKLSSYITVFIRLKIQKFLFDHLELISVNNNHDQLLRKLNLKVSLKVISTLERHLSILMILHWNIHLYNCTILYIFN